MPTRDPDPSKAAGLRERKRLRTLTAIHEAGMRLFAERGFAATTVADIAEAADVSRATVFNYYGTKEDVVFGDAPGAIRALAATLEDRPPGTSALDGVRGWIDGLDGWLADETLPLQLQLIDEVPAVAARRRLINAEIERVIAAALAPDIDAEQPTLIARMIAGTIMVALSTIEREAAQATRAKGRKLSERELEELIEVALAFVRGGLLGVGVGPGGAKN